MVKTNTAKKEILPEKFEVKDLVDMNWVTVQKLFKSLQGREITPADLPQWKLMLGFSNATNSSVKTSMQCFTLTKLPQAVKAMKKAVKNRKY